MPVSFSYSPLRQLHEPKKRRVLSLNCCVDVVFIGPTGSGKSSLIGSICRSVNEEAEFPSKVRLTLNHPEEDSHGTMQWMETVVNSKGTILYQDTRGDQVSIIRSCVVCRPADFQRIPPLWNKQQINT